MSSEKSNVKLLNQRIIEILHDEITTLEKDALKNASQKNSELAEKIRSIIEIAVRRETF